MDEEVSAAPVASAPVMTYLALPLITARLQWWLQGRRWRDR